MSADVLDVADVDQLPDDDDDQGDTADAPYGFLKDGVTPKRKPGPAAGAGKTMPAPKARRTRNGRTASRRGGASPAGRTAPTATAPSVDPVMLAGAEAILGVPTRLFAMAGLATGMTAGRLPEGPKRDQTARLALGLSASACTFIVHGPALAPGMASMADHIPFLAGVYQKAAQVGPYAAVLEAGAGVVLQLLCNFGYVPASPMLGTVDPAELVAQVMGSPLPE